MSHTTDSMRAVLSGKDPKSDDPAYVHHYRVQAAWAQLHDDAEAAFGGDASQFFGPHGAECLKAVEGSAVGTTCDQMLAAGRALITKAGGKLKEVPTAAPASNEPVRSAAASPTGQTQPAPAEPKPMVAQPAP